MSRWRIALIVGGFVVMSGGCSHAAAPKTPGSTAAKPDAAERVVAMARAQVWMPTKVAEMDLMAGPQGPGAIAPFAEVPCTFVEKKLTGRSPKFTCALAPGDEVKVKYGEKNAETYGTVAASRLLWALGFGADAWYPVTVICRGCSRDPRNDPHPAGPSEQDVRFDVASIERRFPGKILETREDEGWKWTELSMINERNGGAPKSHRDALTLLAVFLEHSDSKAAQQRLVCLGSEKKDAGCEQPFMYVHDVGLTFAHATLLNLNPKTGVNFANWQSAPVWKDPKRCVANLSKSWTGTLENPVISEAGRRFLADLLVQLSDKQLTDLFTVARFPRMSNVKVQDWVDLFKRKRDEITSVTCPS